MSGKLLVMGLLVALAISGCGGGDEEKGAGAQGAQTFQVRMALKTDEFNLSDFAYFPKNLTVHPGDTVKFTRPTYDGEPHTVTLGTLVTAAVRKLDQLGPTALPAQQEDTSEFLKLPDVFPHLVTKGSPVVNRSASQPCFVATGQPPGDEPAANGKPAWYDGGEPACRNQTPPAFDGKAAYYNLGLNNEKGDEETLTFSKSIKPGTYGLICLVHRGAMTGKITVAPATRKISTPAQQAARGQREAEQAVAALRPVDAQVKKQATATNAVAGFGNPKNLSAVVAEFAPKNITIKRGTTVSWKMFLFHSMSLNAPEDAIGPFVKDSQGNWVFNPKASLGVPTKLARPPRLTVEVPPVTAKPLVYDGGSFDGRGYQSTGIFGSLPPAFVTFKLRFTQPGSYTLRCVVHPDMKAKVNVT